MGVSLDHSKFKELKHTNTHTLQSNSYYLSPMSYYSWIYEQEPR